MGLVLGDIGYFHSLATIGPRLASVLMATWPIMALAFGPLVGDPFHWLAVPGVLVTVVGVVLRKISLPFSSVMTTVASLGVLAMGRDWPGLPTLVAQPEQRRAGPSVRLAE